MRDEEVKDFVNNILDGNLLDARSQFKDLLAQKKREREHELAQQADLDWMSADSDN